MDTSAASKYYARRGNIGTLTLLGDLRIADASTLRENALCALTDDKATTVRLAMSEVTYLDTAALQILCALKRDIATLGRHIEIIDLSESVSASLTQVGIAL